MGNCFLLQNSPVPGNPPVISVGFSIFPIGYQNSPQAAHIWDNLSRSYIM
jgi:hypothetical protein